MPELPQLPMRFAENRGVFALSVPEVSWIVCDPSQRTIQTSVWFLSVTESAAVTV